MPAGVASSPPKPKPKADSPGADLTDGVKVVFGPREWVMVRPSGTEPILRICAEAGSRARLDELLSRYSEAASSR